MLTCQERNAKNRHSRIVQFKEIPTLLGEVSQRNELVEF